MSAKYKLSYFALQARAELARLAFAAAGVEFEDHVVSDEEWPKLKPKLPMLCLPTLEVDGKTLWQSWAIARYIGREHGMYGKTNMESTVVDICLDSCEDLFGELISIKYGGLSEEKVAEKTKKFLSTTYDLVLSNTENFMNENKSGSGYIVGDGLTIADLCMQHTVNWASTQLPESTSVLDKHPKVKSLVERVAALPNVASYIAKRTYEVI